MKARRFVESQTDGWRKIPISLIDGVVGMTEDMPA